MPVIKGPITFGKGVPIHRDFKEAACNSMGIKPHQEKPKIVEDKVPDKKPDKKSKKVK